MTHTTVAFLGFVLAAALITAGVTWFSVGAGLIAAGGCVAALTVLAFVDVGGDGE